MAKARLFSSTGSPPPPAGDAVVVGGGATAVAVVTCVRTIVVPGRVTVRTVSFVFEPPSTAYAMPTPASTSARIPSRIGTTGRLGRRRGCAAAKTLVVPADA